VYDGRGRKLKMGELAILPLMAQKWVGPMAHFVTE